MLTSYATTYDMGAFFLVHPETLAGDPADLKGSPITVNNANPELFAATLETDGRLKIVPTGVAGVGSVQLTSAPSGVFTAGGVLTITLTAPLPAAQTFDYVLDGTFAV